MSDQLLYVYVIPRNAWYRQYSLLHTKRPPVWMVFFIIASFVHPDSVCVAINPLHFINKGKYDLLLFLTEMGPALKELFLGIG